MEQEQHSADPTEYRYRDEFGYKVLEKMSRVLCEDGRERTITVREPDTFFTIPGFTHTRGKTVQGYVSFDSDKGRMVFRSTGVNAWATQPGAVKRS